MCCNPRRASTIPNFNFNGNGSAYTGIGNWWLVHGRSHNPTVNVTHDRGMHHMKAGWQLRYSYDQDNAGSGPGNFSFNSVDTGKSFLGYDATQSGNMYASALLGVLNGGTATIHPNLDMHQQQWGFYFQDDVKLTRNITLNLGLRWERETAPLEETRKLVKTLDLTNPIPELQGITMPSEVTAISQVAYKYQRRDDLHQQQESAHVRCAVEHVPAARRHRPSDQRQDGIPGGLRALRGALGRHPSGDRRPTDQRILAVDLAPGSRWRVRRAHC